MAEGQEVEVSIIPGVRKKGIWNVLKQTYWYLKRSFIYWTWEARKFWLVMLCIVGATSITMSFPQENYFRYTGLVYQFIGFLIVFCALWSKEKAFGIPSIWISIIQFFNDRPWFWGKGYVLRAEPGRLDIDSLGHVRVITDQSNKSLAVRIAELEELTSGLEKKLYEFDEKHNAHFLGLRRDLEAEKSSRYRESEELRSVTRTAIVGGVKWELIGVIFFVVGIILSTLSIELSRWFA